MREKKKKKFAGANREENDETPVYLSFDNGYTYGGIHQVDFEEAIDDEDE